MKNGGIIFFIVFNILFRFCDWLQYFVAFYQILLIFFTFCLLFLTFWTFFGQLLNILSKLKVNILIFIAFLSSIFLRKDYHFQVKAVYKSTTTIKDKIRVSYVSIFARMFVDENTLSLYLLWIGFRVD